MRKARLLIGSILALGFIFLGGAQLAGAHNFKTGTNVTISQNDKVQHTVFAAGQTVDINSEVFGDVFCAGQTVTISGIVHGDVLCAGQTVNVTGRVDGDVRLVGQTVTLGADVAGNATIGGQSFILESTGKVGGDMTLGSTTATLSGTVGRDLAVGGQTVTVGNSVGRDIKATVEHLQLTSAARVNGNINYTSAKVLDKAPGAVIGGTVSRSNPPEQAKSKHGALFGFGIGWFVYWFLALLLVAMTLALLFPRMLAVATNRAIPRPWKALLIGFIASISMPVLFVLLLVTVVGIPLAFIVGLLWLVILLLSGPLFGYYLGRIILRGSRNPLLIMLVGSAVLLILFFIPLIGFIALLAASWVGSGILLLELFGRTPKPVYSTAVADNRKK